MSSSVRPLRNSKTKQKPKPNKQIKTQCGRPFQYEHATSSKLRKFCKKQRQQTLVPANPRFPLPTSPHAFYFFILPTVHTYCVWERVYNSIIYICFCVYIYIYTYKCVCAIVCNTNLRDFCCLASVLVCQWDVPPTRLRLRYVIS